MQTEFGAQVNYGTLAFRKGLELDYCNLYFKVITCERYNYILHKFDKVWSSNPVD